MVLLLALIAGIGQMWALDENRGNKAGIFDEAGGTVHLKVDGIEPIGMTVSKSGVSNYSPGLSCSSLVLEAASLNTWKTKNQANMCSARFYYKIYQVDESGSWVRDITNWIEKNLPRESDKEDNGKINQTWADRSLGVDLIKTHTLTDNYYVFEFKFDATGDDNSTSDCKGTYYYRNGSSGNSYKIPFTIKRNTCTVSSDRFENVFLFKGEEDNNIYAWDSIDGSLKNAEWPGNESSSEFDQIGDFYVYGIKSGKAVTNYDIYDKFIVNKSSSQTADLSVLGHKGKFYDLSSYNDTQVDSIPVTISRTHYGPMWGDKLNMTFTLKDWDNLEGGRYTITSPDGAIITGDEGTIEDEEGSATCLIELPEGDDTPSGNVRIVFAYTVNHVTFTVTTYVYVYQPIVIKVRDDVGFKNIYMKMTTTRARDWNAWPGIKQEHLGGDWYIVRLNPHLYKFWFNNGSSAKQTYQDGMDISGFSSGQIRRLTKDNENYSDCYLADPEAIGVDLYRIDSSDGTNTYHSNAVTLDATGEDAIMSFYADLYNVSSTYKLMKMEASGTTWSEVDGSSIAKASLTAVYGDATESKPGNIFIAKLNSNSTPTGITDIAVYDRTAGFDIYCGATTANYLTNGEGDTKFIYFEPNATIFPNESFRYYWVDWFPSSSSSPQSVVASVGNAYNDNLANVIGEDIYAPTGTTKSEGGYDGGNVRFGYNPETNYFSRHIIAGSGSSIKIKGTYVTPDGGSAGAEGAFRDASAWVYTISASVKGQATADVTTSYNSFAISLADDQQLLGGDPDSNYDVVITYDFKTNRLLAAWKPSGPFEGFDLQSNLMVVRTENGAPTVLNIVDANDDKSIDPLTGITKIYTVLEITQDNWEQSGGNADRRIVSGDYIDEYYWISLPYECLVRDVFGFEGYGSNGSWVLQTYRGDLRAKKGWWAETNAWWYDLDRTDTLKANEGYVLRVTNLMGENSIGIPQRFAGSAGDHGKLSLFFPSNDNNLTIEPYAQETIKTHLDSLKCTVWRKWETDPSGNKGENNPIWDRRAIDSNWRIIGSPSFDSTKIVAPTFIDDATWGTVDRNEDGVIDDKDYKWDRDNYIKTNGVYGLKYFYTWSVVSNEPRFTITPTADRAIPATHAYLVQYAGDITWQKWNAGNPLVVIQKAPARHQEEVIGDQTLRLVLKQGANEADVAYVSRMAYGATMGYDLNMDLSKMINANSANIYTMGELYKMAGNCIPDTVKTLPVGIRLAADGDYTFAIPEGTYGTGVTLIDKVANTRTNLALTDYTVTLTAGTYDERFELELSPIAQTPTDVEETEIVNRQSSIRKLMIDGVLYIVKDGKVFDARGNRLQ